MCTLAQRTPRACKISSRFQNSQHCKLSAITSTWACVWAQIPLYLNLLAVKVHCISRHARLVPAL